LAGPSGGRFSVFSPCLAVSRRESRADSRPFKSLSHLLWAVVSFRQLRLVLLSGAKGRAFESHRAHHIFADSTLSTVAIDPATLTAFEFPGVPGHSLNRLWEFPTPSTDAMLRVWRESPCLSAATCPCLCPCSNPKKATFPQTRRPRRFADSSKFPRFCADS
jgi:hypothetical protein